MDSLLQTYASSEEEEEEIQQNHRLPISSKPSNFTFSLPPPKSHLSINPNTTRLFSSLPEPQSAQSTLDTTAKQSDPFLRSNKRLVQFKPPIFNPPSSIHDNDCDDEDAELAKRRKQSQSFSTQAPSVSSFLSSIPAPKNSRANLGSVVSSGSGRRSTIDTDVDIPPIPTLAVDNQSSVPYSNDSSSSASYVALDGESGTVHNGDDPLSWTEGYENYESHGGSSSSIGIGAQGNEKYEGHGGSVEQYQYENSLFDGSVTAGLPEMPKSMMKSFKRGRSEIPTQIIEVKQDELMKNRPREDQIKLTGIAFGPSYQPVASTKGKPTKLHKRKHQIGSLYFDMKQKEMELSERRAKGFLTKAETHAKYGW